MKVVILCGGQGTRLREETEFKPKPMVEIGGRPILWHIMKIYSFFGFNDFILCLGYKGEKIKEYFLNYQTSRNDFTIDLGHSSKITYHGRSERNRWKITLADTGIENQTGARLKLIERYVDTPDFMVTYGDGVANIAINKLVHFHQKHGKTATVTGVRPPSRFGELLIKDDRVVDFNEKPAISGGYINGGFFVFNKKIFQYLSKNANCALERDPLVKLSGAGQLMVYCHQEFWQCMDTYRDLQFLERCWQEQKIPWKIWND
ncbi:MAG: glucose-1-phosphate cytidylyltransferase [Elusimicrobia bacterium]|nr:glucose-1-phosphate cytidylyltransferase [Elusimicrobiota bacterium]